MYSRNMSSRRDTDDISLPARYSGVRFRRDKRSDGRDIVIEAPMREPEGAHGDDAREAPSAPPDARTEEKGSVIGKLSSMFGNIGEDDILIAALIIVLAGEGKEQNREAILLLILLLCMR